MVYDYKKKFKEFYLPPTKPEFVHIPKMQFVAVRGKGNPNDEDGEYKNALAVLYAVSYTIKMSKMGEHKIDSYFDFVVPPLEGFWWQISVIRLPDFVSQKDFEWAKETAAKKKNLDCSRAELLALEEGDCIQIMHKGSYDDEPATIKLMDDFAKENGWLLDFSETRLHHEIYLSDPRKSAPEKLRTVIRHPVKKA